MNITIPEHLNALLGQGSLGHAVRLSVQDFEQWIGDPSTHLFFFPEYTDHGPRHISAVLTAAEALIRSEAWEHLTAEDSAVLILATLLHDSAMHLSADGLLDLIESQGKSNRDLIRPLDEKTWSQLFDEFYLEARRWDQRTLHRLLGDQAKAVEDEEDLATCIRHPREKPNPEDWSLRYRKFLGEFVRRHHARLAHEIALSGVPGAVPDCMRLTRVPSAVADLAGLVARSHNMQLRDTFAYLREKYYGRVECSGSHPVLLMVLLRIADYLEFRADRVKPTRLSIQRLRSPISQVEWNVHLAVHDVRPDEEDYEAIFVVAKPPTAQTFFKLRLLLSAIQSELDTSWAVLGEVFSKQGNLSQFGLTLRRIRSNLDNLEKFIQSEQPDYVPIRAAFDTAGVGLLKLLIKPLYGERPEIGVRELLQNALDAVHELRQWASERGDPKLESVPLPNQPADVVISVDQIGSGDYWLTITDKGIGMTAGTVCGYFLKAGASYRQSDSWRREFEVEGKSKVVRSGRFGIGALAAFLLGNRIEICTRHAEAAVGEGLEFSASIDDEIVELRRVARQCVGTMMRVKLTDQTREALIESRLYSDWEHGEQRHPWDWYALDDPSVERRIDGEKLVQKYYLPRPNSALPSDWRSVSIDGYTLVCWSYSEAPRLTCNGIRVERHRYVWDTERRNFSGIVKRPSVNIFDQDGLLPLNLQRSELETGELPFSKRILRDVLADLYAFLLVHSPQNEDAAERWILARKTPFEPFEDDAFTEFERFWLIPEGIVLLHPWHFKKSALRHGFLWLQHESHSPPSRLKSIPKGCLFFGRVSNLGNEIIFGAWEDREYLEKYGNVAGFRFNPVAIKRLDDYNLLLEISFDPSSIRIAKSPAVKFFETVLDTYFIPFDPEERRRRFPGAFGKLRDYVEAWQAGNLQGWRKQMVEQVIAASWVP